MSLKQRVPMGKVEGEKVYVTLEWLKDLNATFATQVAVTTATTTTTATGPSPADFAALLARVVKLEGGYQA